MLSDETARRLIVAADAIHEFLVAQAREGILLVPMLRVELQEAIGRAQGEFVKTLTLRAKAKETIGSEIK